MIKLVRTVEEVRLQIDVWKREGASTGLVPTMGFLHEGHESLIQRAAQENDHTVVSIFVNPTQFAPNEDLAQYPRDIEHDIERCKALGVDLVFIPEPETMYLPGHQTTVSVGTLIQGLCGKSRPTHFQGVCTVVCKLFNIVEPQRAYFGQKDAQQLAVIKRMSRDLNMKVEVIGCPIIREADGLAKSSRNAYLTAEERKIAPLVNKSLELAEAAARAGERNSSTLKQIIRESLADDDRIRVDYIEVVDAFSLQPVTELTEPTLVAVAVFLGKTRLLDNRLIE